MVSPLYVLDVQIVLLAQLVVWPHDPGLGVRAHCATEHSSKSIEAAFLSARYHLRDVHHERALRITACHG